MLEPNIEYFDDSNLPIQVLSTRIGNTVSSGYENEYYNHLAASRYHNTS